MRADGRKRKALAAAAAAMALAAVLGLSACANTAPGEGTSASGDGSGSAMSGSGSDGGMTGGSSNGMMEGSNMAGKSDAANAYRKITAEEGKALMDQGGVTVVDVRTPQEYADGHVPGAINIPNEDIGSTPPSELNSLDDKLVVYCRTGVRSKQASDKLVSMGFTDVNDMGGIVDWPYDTVTGNAPNGS